MRRLPLIFMCCFLAGFAAAGTFSLRELHEARRRELAWIHDQNELLAKQAAEQWQLTREVWEASNRHANQRIADAIYEAKLREGLRSQ